MKYDSEKHHRHSIRLKEYDYSQAGAYFVTICTKDHECLFGEIIDGEMRLNEWGHLVSDVWVEIPNHFTNIELDAFVVMPNHVHGIILIVDGASVEAGLPRPYNKTMSGAKTHLSAETAPLRKRTLGQIIAYFKYLSTRRINEICSNLGAPIWQRNYYEHIIRNEKSLDKIREYIAGNPLRWADDEENPINISAKR